MKVSSVVSVIILVGVISICSIGSASAVDTLWTRSYHYGIWDTVGSMIESTDSGIVMAGVVREEGESYVDLQILKTDRFGNVLWRKVYGNEYQDAGSSIIETDDGGFLVGGQHDGVTGVGPLWVLKTDSVVNRISRRITPPMFCVSNCSINLCN